MRAPRAFVAIIVLVLTACAGDPTGSPNQDASAEGSGSSPVGQIGSPTAEPTSSPVTSASPGDARLVAVDSFVETAADRISVRSEPSVTAARLGFLPAGLRAWVVDGPVTADGYGWYRLTSAPTRAELATCAQAPEQPDLSCSSWIGWVAGVTPDGDEWLRITTVDCPQARDVAAYLSLLREERLFCAGDDEWRLRVYVPPLEGGRGCYPMWVNDPAWMDRSCAFSFPQAEERRLDEDSSLQMFTPPELNTCGELGVCWWDELKGKWVIIAGHLDDPVARTCHPVLSENFAGEDVGPPPETDLWVHYCRTQFVASSVKEAASQ